MKRRQILTIVVAGCYFPGSFAAHDNQPNIQVVAGPDFPARDLFKQQLLTAFSRLIFADAYQSSAVGLTVLAGTKAVQAFIEGNGTNIAIAMFVSRSQWAAMNVESKRITAIYQEASVADQLLLIENLFFGGVDVGVMLGDNSKFMEKTIREEFGKSNSRCVIEYHKTGERVTKTIQRFDGIRCLLAIPDRELYNQGNIREILESTYRRQLPIIGFSAGLVNIGTLATVYSSVEDIVAQLTEIVDSIQRGKIPPSGHPKYWQVTINRSVARSLNIDIPETVSALRNKPKG